MSNQVSGLIKLIKEERKISDKFSVREFVVTTNESFPQDILLQATKDKCGMLDSFKVGELVTASYNLNGRLWTSPQGEDRYFNTLNLWRIEKATADVPNASQPQAPPTANGEVEPLPF